jgi:hypothetical protein
MNAKLFFSADYRDGRVRIGNKTYSAGYYCVHLLNQYYKDDTAARISVFTNQNWQLQEQMKAGYLNTGDFTKAGDEICNIFQALQWLKPFDALDIKAERNRVANLFTSKNAEMLMAYFQRRAAVGNMDEGQVLLHLLPPEYDKAFFEQAESVLIEVHMTLQFYDRIGADIRKAFSQLVRFVECADEAERLDEAHLLPIAKEVFGELPLPVTTEYVPYKKNAKSKSEVVARRLYFDSYYSFIITDFFEGLHYGHYPRQCAICKNYFLMTSARRQQYCSGMSPYTFRGKKISCKQYAASINRKELAAADPVVDIYNRRCGAIRSEKSRGTITAEFATKAKELALEHKLHAQEDPVYAATQYPIDMTRQALYEEAGNT